MKFRNLLVYDSFLKDFKIHLQRMITREDFANMCTDLTLPGNVTYTDNEVYDGYSCNDYKEKIFVEIIEPCLDMKIIIRIF